jgi:NAD(P)-dependent dehydrogenase (short-subunit alcohol dehydrogenase family)
MSNQLKTIHLDTVLASHSKDMTGKTVAVTGTTSGTGYIAAREMGRLGAEVILLNRKSQRADTALQDLKQEVPNGKFSPIECDLQSIKSVEKTIAEIKEKYSCLDVLCNNAGVMALEDISTDDGYDVQMHTNVISHFQLVRGLLPLLKNSEEARVVNHTSMARMGGPLESKYFAKNGGNLGGNGTESENASFSGPRWERYHQSKLANFVFTYALKQKLEANSITNIKSLVAHPGLARTNLQSTTAKTGGMDNSGDFMNNAQSAEDGATGIIRACMDPAGQTGDFFGPEQWTGFPKLLTPEEDLISQANIDTFWQACEAAIGKMEF